MVFGSSVFGWITGLTREAAAAGAITLALLLSPAAAQDGSAPLTADQEAAVEGIIQRYLNENPQVIVDALRAMQARAERQAEEETRETIARLRDRLIENDGLPMAGNPDGDITVVEFFDYHCGYCKRVMDDIVEVIETDGNVRFVFFEFPILSENSRLAARAALAARFQDPDIYFEFHRQLMDHSGRHNADSIRRIATDLELDVDQLFTDIQDDRVTQMLRYNFELAEELGVSGTPAFIVGDELIPGAIGISEMRRLIEVARESS